MELNFSIKKAMNNHGPIRKDNSYLVSKMDDEYLVIVTTFQKTTFYTVKIKEINFENFSSNSVITEKMVYEMLCGIRYYTELSDPYFYKDKVKPCISYTLEDFYKLISIYNDGIDLDKASTLFKICMLYLHVTYEGSKLVNKIASKNVVLNDDSYKIASFLYSVHIILKKDKRTLIDTKEFILEFENNSKKFTDIFDDFIRENFAI